MTMDLKSRFKNTTAMRYTEWFSDKEAFVFPPKDALDAAMRQAKKEIRAKKTAKQGERIVEAVKEGKPMMNVLREMREEASKSKIIDETVGFQFKDW